MQRVRSLIFKLLILLCINPVPGYSAWSMYSQFQMMLDQRATDNTVEQIWEPIEGSERFQLQNQQTQVLDQIPVYINGIHGSVSYKIGKPEQQGDSLEWLAKSSDLYVELTVDSISASGTIERWEGSTRLQINVSATCNNVRFQIPLNSGAEIVAGVNASMQNGEVQFNSPWSRVDWPANAWQVIDMDCRGFGDIESIVKEQALAVLRTPQQEVQAEVAKAIQAELGILEQEVPQEISLPTLKFADREDIEISIEPQKVEQLGEGKAYVDGTLKLRIADIAPEQDIVTNYNFSDNPIPNPNSEIQLPSESLKGFLMGALVLKAFKTELSGYKIKAWRDFMHNRWQQFFAWSDLLNYDKNADFRFQSQVPSLPVITKLNNLSDGIIQADFSIPLHINMLHPSREGHQPYVQFKTTIRGTANMTILSNDALHVEIAEVSTDKMQYSWSKQYVDKNFPNQSISIDTITDYLVEHFEGQSYSTSLPYWEWENGEKLSAKKFFLAPDVFHISWKLN